MNWAYTYTPDIWPALITLALLICLGTYSWQRRHIPAARFFTMACVFGGLWTLGVILELSALNASSQIFWKKFQAIWHLPSAAIITCFVLQYAGLGRWLTPRNCVLLFLVPLVCALLMITNDFHHLIWAGFILNGHVTASPGSLFWAFISYGIFIGFLNLLVLVWLAISSPMHRWPVAIMLVGQMIGRLGYTFDKLDTGLIGPGESVFIVVGVASAAYAVAFLRFHTIDPVAAARRAVLQQMNEGLYVLDLQGRIVDLNRTATAILGIPENRLRGKPLMEVMSVDTRFIEQLENESTGPTEILLGKDNSVRQYNMNLTKLKGRHDEVIGQLLLLHDITEQKKAQTKILEQQRIVATLQEQDRLARELHDGISQTLGYVIMQTQGALKWLHDGNSEKACPLLERLVQVTRDTHAGVRESILNLKTGKDQGESFIQTLKEHIDRFQANYGIRTELLLSDGIDETTFNSETGIQLLGAIQEGLTNVGKHSEARNLQISSKLNEGTAQISITDDGHGFDVGQLKRGVDGHFGLGFMQQRMAQIGGSVKITSEPGAGTTLTLAVPLQKHEKDTQ
jgi:PAS domain S-box-containing protein